LQPPHAVPAYIAGADIGIIARQGRLQNLRLSLPNRLFQMIAARLPVVATPLPEISHFVRTWRLGLLFDESDSAGLAAAVRRLIEPSALPQFRDAADKAARALTWDRESATYVRSIERLAGRGRDRGSPANIVSGVRGLASGGNPDEGRLGGRK
jgi:glycosyltransferase involved in cell wall biosynthesis